MKYVLISVLALLTTSLKDIAACKAAITHPESSICNLHVELIKKHRFDLKNRIQASKVPTAITLTNIKIFQLESLEDDTVNQIEQKSLSEFLERHHYVIVRLPRSQETTMLNMWKQLRCFFMEIDDESVKHSKVRPMEEINGKVLGYAKFDNNEFIETRIDSEGNLQPSLTEFDGFDGDIKKARSALTRIAAAVVRASASHVHLDPSQLCMLMDNDTKSTDELSDTVHRLCRYTPPLKSDGTLSNPSAITFGAHTDTTMVTLVPCSSTPGLEIYTSETGWVCPESMDGMNCRDVIVLTGELLQALSDGRYPAAVHRVVAPRNDRLSAPLLVRCNPNAIIKVEVLHRNNGANQPRDSAVLDGLPMLELHRELNQPLH